MSVPTPLPEGATSHNPGPEELLLRQETQRVQMSGVLGEARQRKLFDYLAKTSLAGQSPKEIAIAMDVFGKTANFDVSQDALVRVYIHKLRKALEDFYADPPAGAATLQIPRGEYRLRVGVPVVEDSPPRMVLDIKRRLPVVAIAAAVMIAILTIAALWQRLHRTNEDQVRASPIWSGMLADDRPIMIVLGDYYLIGDTDNSMDVKRLVREYSVNSKSDLEAFVQQHPEFAARYMDVGIRYLPISAATALRDVMVVLAPQNRRVTISKISDLEPGSLKSADLVYIGYLSGMGMLQDVAFSGSRFAVGESYDELVDKKAKHTYISGVGGNVLGPAPPSGKEQPYRDYGIFQKLQGPGGNTILVIAGTRDEGVSQTAETFTNAQKLSELARLSDLSLPTEDLLEARSLDGTNLSGAVLLQSSREKTK